MADDLDCLEAPMPGRVTPWTSAVEAMEHVVKHYYCNEILQYYCNEHCMYIPMFAFGNSLGAETCCLWLSEKPHHACFTSQY